MKILTGLMFLACFASFADVDDEAGLNLDSYTDFATDYFGSYYPSQHLTGYGTGGYGDPLSSPYSLNVCGSGNTSSSFCTSEAPDTRISEWRFIPSIGWRKFSGYGAMRKDWWDFKKTQRWPFSWQQKHGYNWW